MDGDKKRLSRLDEEDGGLDETRGGEKESSPESNTSRPSLEKKKINEGENTGNGKGG